MMEQETLIESNLQLSVEKIEDGLITCVDCNKIVPETMICVYCGAPLLFKKHLSALCRGDNKVVKSKENRNV